MEYLGKVLEKYTTTEPMLTKKDIAIVITWWLGDISEIVKIIKKESKK